MHINTEKDISGDIAKQLRANAKLTQKQFWYSLGLTQSGGSRYERLQAIPRPVRILIFAMYVAGIQIDATSEQGAAQLIALAKKQSH